MNYVAHHEVARRVSPEATPDFLLGSCISDFARMADARGFLTAIPNDDIQKGIQFHNDTNRAFDALPEMKDIEDGMKILFREYLPKWEAIKAARAGKDILFDGLFTPDREIIGALTDTLGRALRDEITGLKECVPLLDTIAEVHHNGPPHYELVAVSAVRLFMVLFKSGTELSQESIEDIEKVLGHFQHRIFAVGNSAMNETVRVLSANY